MRNLSTRMTPQTDSIPSAPPADKPSISLDTDKMRELRLARKLTQAQASEAAGLRGAARWNDIESGRRTNITLETLDAIAKALKVKARDLLK
jgi:DNA-binding Xre family transcriptional regulator